LVGILSFSMFICLVVVSLIMFGTLSIFYITLGTVCYWFLMKTLFGRNEKSCVLAYLVFEALQIGFYFACILWILMTMLAGPPTVETCTDDGNSTESTTTSSSDKTGANCVISSPQDVQSLLFQIFICLVLIDSTKLYFARVFSRFYKFLVWQEKREAEIFRAHYVNGRGIQLNLDDIFPPSNRNAPQFWNPITSDGYGYAINPSGLPKLPSYNQTVNTGSFVNPSDEGAEVQKQEKGDISSK